LIKNSQPFVKNVRKLQCRRNFFDSHCITTRNTDGITHLTMREQANKSTTINDRKNNYKLQVFWCKAIVLTCYT